MNWHESLPTQCPEEGAFKPENKAFYRLCNDSPASSIDFLSQRMENPKKTFAGISECIIRSVSIWDDEEKCKQLLKLPSQKGKKVGKFSLNNDDGLIKNTFKPNHFSWWRTDKFNHELVVFN